MAVVAFTDTTIFYRHIIYVQVADTDLIIQIIFIWTYITGSMVGSHLWALCVSKARQAINILFGTAVCKTNIKKKIAVAIWWE